MAQGLSIGALGLSVVALGIALVSMQKAPPAADTGGGVADEARIARLEEQVARLADRGRNAPAPRSRDASAAGAKPAGDASIAARLADLEESVEDLEKGQEATTERLAAIAEAGRTGIAENRPPTLEQIAELRKLVLDTKAEPRPRLLAMRQLARVEDGRTLETARAMKKLFEESTDEWTRTAAVAFLEGFHDPELEPWLVETLLNDRFSSTRESTTDVLSHYTGSPRVRDALTDAAANDKNHDVRADAQNALDKLDEREE